MSKQCLFFFVQSFTRRAPFQTTPHGKNNKVEENEQRDWKRDEQEQGEGQWWRYTIGGNGGTHNGGDNRIALYVDRWGVVFSLLKNNQENIYWTYHRGENSQGKNGTCAPTKGVMTYNNCTLKSGNN